MGAPRGAKVQPPCAHDTLQRCYLALGHLNMLAVGFAQILRRLFSYKQIPLCIIFIFKQITLCIFKRFESFSPFNLRTRRVPAGKKNTATDRPKYSVQKKYSESIMGHLAIILSLYFFWIAVFLSVRGWGQKNTATEYND